jgi:hypothetical protein
MGQGWAEPSWEHLAQLMRQVVSDRAEAHRRARQARRDMVEKWDRTVMGPLWAAQFQRLLG